MTEIYIGIYERDSNGKKTEINVATWKKIEDCHWSEAAKRFKQIPQQIVVMRPRPEMLNPGGIVVKIGDKRIKEWGMITFDEAFVADFLRRELLEKVGLAEPRLLEQARAKLSEWLEWISQSTEREYRARIESEIAKVQQEYKAAYGSELTKEEAVRSLKVVQPTLMASYPS